MFILKKKFRFEASHQLIHHDGKCARLHGHSWQMIVAVRAFDLQGRFARTSLFHSTAINPKTEMVMDYSDLKAIVQPIIDERLDHWHLNDTFQTDMPTSEHIAMNLFHVLKRKLEGWQLEKFPAFQGNQKIELAYVEIKETCTSGCRYSD